MDDLFKHLAFGSWTTSMDKLEIVIILLLPYHILIGSSYKYNFDCYSAFFSLFSILYP